MKKIVSILLAIVLVCALAAFAGCGGKTDGNDNGSTQPTDVSTEPASGDNGETASPQAKKTWSDDTADYTYYVMHTNYGVEAYIAITNKSDKDISISLTAYPKDASGAAVGSDDCWINVNNVGPGRTTLRVMDLSIGEDAPVETVEFAPEYSDSLYKDATADLSVKTDPITDGLSVEVTNNGTEAATDVFVYVLFFDASGAVVFESAANLDSIDAGATGSAEVNCFTEYTTFDVYLSGTYGMSF